MTDLGIYLYAVGRDLDDADLPPGVEGQQPRIARADGLDVVVSDVPMADFDEAGLRSHLEDLSWLERVARAHNGVLETLSERATVVPAGLATVFHDESGLRDRIDDWREQTEETLLLLDGRVELGVKVYRQDQGSSEQPEPTETGSSPGGSGAAYLRRRRDERERRTALVDDERQLVDGLRNLLCDKAVRERTHDLQDPRLTGRPEQMLLNASYLVPNEAQRELEDRSAEYAAAHPGLLVEVTGPWAPYSFAALGSPE
ncbi:GvpL/GvpF family gas vesicle protein [Luteipulveratus sp. YIM 133132]|uniref:GvpL/GvpF family gas vesicle protein n=1 Tax=Luteipulveratus flavus TaxID=3031728 RepID=UPI0023B12915|nr:GvpL/GvpF family gas vesicle protein [Luteipulveratus sp. YIM 133132]MDE9366915.1 GvpL/GvpF family gas vesicle protein [Luteipulveratus sp. YIM 133132]